MNTIFPPPLSGHRVPIAVSMQTNKACLSNNADERTCGAICIFNLDLRPQMTRQKGLQGVKRKQAIEEH